MTNTKALAEVNAAWEAYHDACKRVKAAQHEAHVKYYALYKTTIEVIGEAAHV